MIPTQAISLFTEQLEMAIRQGFTIDGIEAQPAGDDDILVSALTEDQSVLAAVIFPDPAFPLKEIERFFAVTAATMVELRKVCSILSGGK